MSCERERETTTSTSAYIARASGDIGRSDPFIPADKERVSAITIHAFTKKAAKRARAARERVRKRDEEASRLIYSSLAERKKEGDKQLSRAFSPPRSSRRVHVYVYIHIEERKHQTRAAAAAISIRIFMKIWKVL